MADGLSNVIYSEDACDNLKIYVDKIAARYSIKIGCCLKFSSLSRLFTAGCYFLVDIH